MRKTNETNINQNENDSNYSQIKRDSISMTQIVKSKQIFKVLIDSNSVLTIVLLICNEFVLAEEPTKQYLNECAMNRSSIYYPQPYAEQTFPSNSQLLTEQTLHEYDIPFVCFNS
jgi:hypothetical protein